MCRISCKMLLMRELLCAYRRFFFIIIKSKRANEEQNHTVCCRLRRVKKGGRNNSNNNDNDSTSITAHSAHKTSLLHGPLCFAYVFFLIFFNLIFFHHHYYSVCNTQFNSFLFYALSFSRCSRMFICERTRAHSFRIYFSAQYCHAHTHTHTYVYFCFLCLSAIDYARVLRTELCLKVLK